MFCWSKMSCQICHACLWREAVCWKERSGRSTILERGLTNTVIQKCPRFQFFMNSDLFVHSKFRNGLIKAHSQRCQDLDKDWVDVGLQLGDKRQRKETRNTGKCSIWSTYQILPGVYLGKDFSQPILSIQGVHLRPLCPWPQELGKAQYHYQNLHLLTLHLAGFLQDSLPANIVSGHIDIHLLEQMTWAEL